MILCGAQFGGEVDQLGQPVEIGAGSVTRILLEGHTGVYISSTLRTWQ